jgi:hypothetical protein
VAVAREDGDESMVMACAGVTGKLKECVDREKE